MRHVFLETNWLVAVAKPAHDRTPAALELLDSASDGRIRIYIPACCIGEARKTIRQKFQPKEADRLRSYVRWAVEQKLLDQQTDESARVMLSSFVGRVTSELAALNDTLRGITSAVGVEIVRLDHAVLDMSLELHFREIDLSEFDRAVLAAVLMKGRSLRDSGEGDVNFCELDSKLWPWEKGSPPRPRAELQKLYDDAGVWVYSDFTLTNPERREGFPEATHSD
jgi:predicted nucleic acid-binding protein